MRWIWLIAWTVAAVLGFSGGVRAAGPWGGTRGGGGGSGGGGGITNGAGSNVVMKSDGTNAVSSNISDNGTTVTIAGSGFDVPADSITDAEVSNTLTCSAASGNFTITGGSLATGSHALDVTGTLAAGGGSGAEHGEYHLLTANGSSSNVPVGAEFKLVGNYSRQSESYGLVGANDLPGTNQGFYYFSGNRGIFGVASGTGTNADNWGVVGSANTGKRNMGVAGNAIWDKANGVNIGVVGNARNEGSSGINVGVLAMLLGNNNDPTGPTIVDAALLVDNMDTTDPVAVFRDNGTAVLTIADNGTTTLAGDPSDATTANAMLRVVPSGSGANELLMFADGSGGDFTVDREGDVSITGTLTVGNVSNTELGYIDGLTSSAQTQITNSLDVVDEYTTPGTTTWTKPTGCKSVMVTLVGGGGAGGSGRRGATNTDRYGGGGGGAGQIIQMELGCDAFDDTETVTVGAGGTGGAAVTGNDTSGNPGTGGGASSLTLASGKTITASVGPHGTGGTAAAGAAAGITTQYLWHSIGDNGVGGGAGSNGNGNNVNNTTNNICWPTSGGGGGGIPTGNSSSVGGHGGPRTGFVSVTGAARGEIATPTGTDGAVGFKFCGGHGAGGGASTGTGGTGGAPGGGGGGGGASLNGTNSGAGGNGGAGAVYIVTRR